MRTKVTFLVFSVALALAVRAEQLRFMTFNVWGDYFQNPVSEREADVEAVILKDTPDVVSLQEVTPNWYKSPMFANLKKAGYAIVRGDEAAALKRAAFSGRKTARHINHEPLLYKTGRLKMLASGTEFFHLSLQTSKSVTWAVLEDKTDGRRFVAFGTHFWWQSNGKESDAIRELNARLVLSILSSVRREWGAELPAVLGGDLNSTEKSIAHAMLRSGGFMNAATAAPVRSPHCSHHGDPKRGDDGKWRGRPCAGKNDTPERSIDHVYFTRGVRPLRHETIVEQQALDASDHSPVVFDFDLSPGKPRPRPMDGMRLMSYNIHHGAGADGVLDLQRIAEVIVRENPDIVGLNEVDCHTRRSGGIDEAEELARLTGMRATFAKAMPYQGGGYGNAILSREAPLSVESAPLPGKEPRVLLLCEFKDFWFGTAHFDFGKFQEATVEAVRAALAAKSASKPVFISGDWNARPDSRTLATMKEFAAILSDESRRTFHGFMPCEDGNVPCIDYIAVDSAHSDIFAVDDARVVPETVASDHCPIAVDLSRKARESGETR